MKVYFVRHGESIQNAAKVAQHPSVELSQQGLKQAEFVAKRFIKIPVDIILSSHYKRAEQTTNIINKILNKEIIYTELLAEQKQPSVNEGKRFDHPNVVKARELRRKYADDPKWHYSDEENFNDVKIRANKFIDFLSKRKEKDILVVTHSFILRMVVLNMTFGDDFSSKTFFDFFDHFRLENTGITLCENDSKGENDSSDERGSDVWRIVTWNDHAHLG